MGPTPPTDEELAENIQRINRFLATRIDESVIPSALKLVGLGTFSYARSLQYIHVDIN